MVSKTEFLKVAREGDETLIDGVSPWAHKWEIASNSAFATKHPSYPNRPYAVHCYEIVVDGKTIRFLAGKIEEGVWAFYRIARLPW